MYSAFGKQTLKGKKMRMTETKEKRGTSSFHQQWVYSLLYTRAVAKRTLGKVKMEEAKRQTFWCRSKHPQEPGIPKGSQTQG